MSPNEAYEDANYNIVMKNHELRYTKALNNRRKPKYKLGDMVRIYTLTKGGGYFRKGQKPAFSNEVFSRYKVDTRLYIPRYYLSDSKNEKIEGSFQAHELSIERKQKLVYPKMCCLKPINTENNFAIKNTKI